MKTYILSIFSLIPTLISAQIGIGTNTPLEKLHVAGATSGVRIEGLNAPNNPSNMGTGSSSRVYADAEGDLVLGTATSDVEVLFSPDNYLSDAEDTGGADANVINQTGTGSGYTIAGWPRVVGAGSSNFTLTRNAIIEINYSVSWNIEKSNIPVNDQHARIVQTFLYLIKEDAPGAGLVQFDIDGNPVSGDPAFTYPLGINGQFYTNGADGGGAADEGAYQGFHNTGTDYVKLGPGRYRPMFAAQLAVGNTSGTGAVQMFLGTGNDEVQVIAHYYN
ncbi:hypothetical protein EQG63_03810 [Flavobacterium amnicola]|uniref:Uncharacterized protein n=1 Tax=Flavobacterium amnicola TaxID=2506422 RepID=A0A4Q1K6J6_9FLAO|nr:hypothetical protein [Flavobacterium amnicola]RXR21075.1 hypothetical protein EQG63_03810 [Flavobacterium amnicola]